MHLNSVEHCLDNFFVVSRHPDARVYNTYTDKPGKHFIPGQGRIQGGGST